MNPARKMIAKDNNFLILKLNPNLHDRETVFEAFEELKKFADAEIEEDEYLTIRIRETEDSEKTGYEFLNYLLKLMRNNGVA